MVWKNPGTRLLGALLPVLAVVVLTAPPAVAKKKDSGDTEKFRANVIAAQRGRSSQVDILIRRWSTDEERTELFEVLKKNDPRAFSRALRDQKEVGWVQPRGERSYKLRYARNVMDGDKRMVVLATDRPVAMREASGGTQSMDFSTSLIVLNLDAEGNGDGQFSIGTEVLFDEAANSLQITNAGIEPLRLTNVQAID